MIRALKEIVEVAAQVLPVGQVWGQVRRADQSLVDLWWLDKRARQVSGPLTLTRFATDTEIIAAARDALATTAVGSRSPGQLEDDIANENT
jgi:hypothetical protein